MKTLKSLLLGAGAMMAMLTACSGNATLTESGLDPAKFDTTINDKPVKLFVLKNATSAHVSYLSPCLTRTENSPMWCSDLTTYASMPTR